MYTFSRFSVFARTHARTHYAVCVCVCACACVCVCVCLRACAFGYNIVYKVEFLYIYNMKREQAHSSTDNLWGRWGGGGGWGGGGSGEKRANEQKFKNGMGNLVVVTLRHYYMLIMLPNNCIFWSK